MHSHIQRPTDNDIQRHPATPRPSVAIGFVAIPAASNRIAVVAVAGVLAAAEERGQYVLEDGPHGGHTCDDYEEVGFSDAPVETADVVILSRL